MPDILHRIGVQGATPERVFEALTTVDGLSAWWTEDTRLVDGVLRFRFKPGGFDMAIEEERASSLVRWRVVDGPAEWVGTRIHWELRQDGDYTIVLFKHEGWREPVEFMHHCSTKWGQFLMSLKKLGETGAGDPSPRDVHIDDWN